MSTESQKDKTPRKAQSSAARQRGKQRDGTFTPLRAPASQGQGQDEGDVYSRKDRLSHADAARAAPAHGQAQVQPVPGTPATSAASAEEKRLAALMEREIPPLEASLKKIRNPGSGEARDVREALLALYREALLLSPPDAARRDVHGSLWKNVFYGPISALRDRLRTETAAEGAAKLRSSLLALLDRAEAFFEDALQEILQGVEDAMAQRKALLWIGAVQPLSRRKQAVLLLAHSFAIVLGDLARYRDQAGESEGE
jgi:hypothetical protein